MPSSLLVQFLSEPADTLAALQDRGTSSQLCLPSSCTAARHCLPQALVSGFWGLRSPLCPLPAARIWGVVVGVE